MEIIDILLTFFNQTTNYFRSRCTHISEIIKLLDFCQNLEDNWEDIKPFPYMPAHLIDSH
jgi:hypothetical protein